MATCCVPVLLAAAARGEGEAGEKERKRRKKQRRERPERGREDRGMVVCVLFSRPTAESINSDNKINSQGKNRIGLLSCWCTADSVLGWGGGGLVESRRLQLHLVASDGGEITLN